MSDVSIGKLHNFFERTGFYKVIRNPKSFEDFIQLLDIETFEKLLIHFNGLIRGIPIKQRDLAPGYMLAGELVSPGRKTKLILFEEYFKALKKLDNNLERGILSYYMINSLHLFTDGNGRLSRLICEIFVNPHFNMLDEAEITLHDNRGLSLETSEYSDNKGFASLVDIRYYASYEVFIDLINMGLIPNDPRLMGKCLTTGSSGDYDNLYLPDDIDARLSDEQYDQIVYSLLDNGDYYSVGALTLLVMEYKKGLLDECLKADEELKKTCLSSEINERNHVLQLPVSDRTPIAKDIIFKGWTLDDYLETVLISDMIKKANLRKIIDIFINPTKHMVDGQTILSEIVGVNQSSQSKVL